MSWLIRNGDVLAALENRRFGWPSALQGAVILRGPAVVQTLTHPIAFDLAWCSTVESDGAGECLLVKRIGCLGPRKVIRLHLGPRPMVVASQGAFERWKLKVGDRLEVRRV